MNASYENPSTKALCDQLKMADALGLFQECEKIVDTLRARHPEVQAAVMAWAESANTPEEVMRLHAIVRQAALDAADHG